MSRFFVSAGLLGATLPLIGCNNLSKFSYSQKADGTSSVQAAGQSKDGAAKLNYSAVSGQAGVNEAVNIKYEAVPQPVAK